MYPTGQGRSNNGIPEDSQANSQQAWPPLPAQRHDSPASPYSVPVKSALIVRLGIYSIVGAVLCGIFGTIPGIFAWVMGNKALAAIDSGVADPAQRRTVVTGRNCGIAGIVVAALMIVASITFYILTSANKTHTAGY